mgnify:CR=1 FL=1
MNSLPNADGAVVRLVAVGDIGHTSTFHVGDEAMVRGLLDGVAATGLDARWTLLSMDPVRSSALFEVPAVLSLGFRDCDTPAWMKITARQPARLAPHATERP